MATILKNLSSIATDPVRNFRFLVTFLPQNVSGQQDGTGKDVTGNWAQDLSKISFGFTSVSGLAVTTDSIPYREGGYNTTVHQIPGQTSFAPLTLQRGLVLGTPQNWNWMRQLFQTVMSGPSRENASNFRCDIEIDVLSHPSASTAATVGNGTQDDHVAVRFKVYNAWITSLAYSDLNAGDNAIFVEQMQLVHEGFEAHFATGTAMTQTAPTY